MGALPAKQNQYVEYAEKDAKMRPIADEFDELSEFATDTQGMIASKFSPNTGYGVGSLVIYQGKLYKCVKFHYGAWSGVDFQESTVSQGMSNDRANVVNLAGVIAQQYSADATYAVGDYVLNNYNLYVCNTAIETAELWNAAHWTLVTDKIINMITKPIYCHPLEIFKANVCVLTCLIFNNSPDELNTWNKVKEAISGFGGTTYNRLHVSGGYYESGIQKTIIASEILNTVATGSYRLIGTDTEGTVYDATNGVILTNETFTVRDDVNRIN